MVRVMLQHPLNRREQSDRRHRPTSPLHGVSLWRGRRGAGRRYGEQKGRYVDRYASHYRFLVAGVMAFSALDAHFTLKLLSLGSEELNPVMAWLLGFGTEIFLYVKLVLTALGVAVLVLHTPFLWLRAIPVRSLLYVVCAVYGAMVSYQAGLLIYIA